MSTVGVIANPMSGKDIRRLVAHASPTSDAAKVGVVRRVVLGALAAGATRVLLSPDRRNLCARAIEELDVPAGITIEVLGVPTYGFSEDSTRVAESMRALGVRALVVLGGDGTNRDVAKGWLDVPIVSISTGTNNVFPVQVEATVAGAAAAIYASGAFDDDALIDRANVLHVRFETKSAQDTPDDLALVDVALVDGSFTGSRAVWEMSGLRALIAAIAEPDTVGLSSIAGLRYPKLRTEPGAVEVRFGPGGSLLHAPIAPGSYEDVAITGTRFVDEGSTAVFDGPGVLSFDGERDHVLQHGERCVITVRRNGPRVISVRRALAAAAGSTVFARQTPTNTSAENNVEKAAETVNETVGVNTVENTAPHVVAARG